MSPAAFLIGAIWLGLVVTPVLVNWSRYCYPAYDLGIYAQAMQKIRWSFSMDDLNPWLSVRQLRIFNDHFDPILVLFAPLAKWIEPSLAAILIELAFVSLTGAFLARRSLCAAAVFLFSTGTTAAVTFPSHPATWSVLPLAILLLALERPIEDRTVSVSILFWSVALLTFKEEYVPVLLFLAGSLVFARALPRRTGLILVLISLLWGVGVFWLRPMLLGPTSGYGSSFVGEWVGSPMGAFRTKILDAGVWRGIRDLILPFVPVWIWMFRERIRPALPAVLVFAALFGIRLISGRWSHHYWIPLSVCLVMIPGVYAWRRIPKKAFAWSVALLLLVQLPYLGRNVAKTLFRGGLAHCPGDPERISELAEVRRLVLEQPTGTPVLAPNRLIPRLLGRQEIRLVDLDTEVNESSFFVISSLSDDADHWPFTREQYRSKIAAIKSGKKTELLYEGRWTQLEIVGLERNKKRLFF